jgi:hypothetical protein
MYLVWVDDPAGWNANGALSIQTRTYACKRDSECVCEQASKAQHVHVGMRSELRPRVAAYNMAAYECYIVPTQVRHTSSSRAYKCRSRNYGPTLSRILTSTTSFSALLMGSFCGVGGRFLICVQPHMPVLSARGEGLGVEMLPLGAEMVPVLSAFGPAFASGVLSLLLFLAMSVSLSLVLLRAAHVERK